jgi:hypothetical protein
MNYNENNDIFEDDEAEVKDVQYDKDLYPKVIENLFRAKDIRWCKEYDLRTDYSNFVLQRWLVRYDSIRVQSRWLDKYTELLPKSMFLSLAWSIIPKVNVAERLPYFYSYKMLEEKEEYSFILLMIRKQYQLSDNDYNSLRDRVVKAIEKDLVSWFSYYGVHKTEWTKRKLNFNLIKTFEEKGTAQQILGR